MHSKAELLDWKTQRITKDVLKVFERNLALATRRYGAKPESLDQAAINEIFNNGIVFAHNELLNLVKNIESELRESEEEQ